jgi:hypothetical protein
MAGAENDEARFDLVIEPEQLAGVWANRVRVIRGEHEFTLDFVRLDHRHTPPRRGIIVARVAVSAGLVVNLLDQLQAQWDAYARQRLQQEMPEESGPGSGQDEDHD